MHERVCVCVCVCRFVCVSTRSLLCWQWQLCLHYRHIAESTSRVVDQLVYYGSTAAWLSGSCGGQLKACLLKRPIHAHTRTHALSHTHTHTRTRTHKHTYALSL